MKGKPLYYCKNISLTYGTKPLFENISAQISAGEIIALVGRNGSGKSTLLKLMARVIEADYGECYYQPNIQIGYLAQQPEITEDLSVYEYVLQNISVDDDQTKQHKIYLADIILDKLKLSGQKMLSQLSGGKLRRADLARTLVTSPHLLFLDEPTNHLDLSSIEWLEEYLHNFAGGIVTVSHDRSFLRNISNKTLWLDRGKLLVNNKGYEDFERWSEEIFNQEAVFLSKQAQELDKELLWHQQGVTARRKRNQQRLHNLQALRIKHKNDQARHSNISAGMKLAPIPSTNQAKLLVEMENVGFSFTDSVPEKLILKPFSLRIFKGEVIGVIGKNGAGKTTLIKLITNQLAPSQGKIRFGTNLQYSYLDQNRSTLEPNQTLWQTLCPNGGDTVFFPNGQTKHVVGYLKDFLFDSKQANACVATLSGGERNRLLLAKLLLNPGNFLILDEPTNDLDIDTLDMLIEILSEYQGTLLIVSHDRDFLERLVTRTLIINQSTISDFIGGYYDYMSTIKAKNIVTKSVSKTQTQQVKNNKKPMKKLSYKDERELSLLPQNIDNITKEIQLMENELNDPNLYQQDPTKFHQLTSNITAKKLTLGDLETRWLELEEMKQSL